MKTIEALVRSLEAWVEIADEEDMRGHDLRALADGVELLHQNGAGAEFARNYPAMLRLQAKTVDVAHAGWEAEGATHH
jgi:hypothetical protein